VSAGRGWTGTALDSVRVPQHTKPRKRWAERFWNLLIGLAFLGLALALGMAASS
jgi:hypothetical protein